MSLAHPWLRAVLALLLAAPAFAAPERELSPAPPAILAPTVLPASALLSPQAVLPEVAAIAPAEPAPVAAAASLEALGAQAAQAQSAQAPQSFAESISHAVDGTVSPKTADPTLYLYSRTLDTTVSLGPVARKVHYAREALWQAGKVYLAWRVGGPAAAALWWATYELPGGLVTLGGVTMADLNFRYWRKRLALLKNLARQPGVERLRVLSGSSVEFHRLLASTQRSRALVMAEAAAPPAADPALGEPLAVDPGAARLRVKFAFAGAASPVEWTPTLTQVLERRPIPEETATAWRAHLNAALSRDGFFKRWFSSLRLRQAHLPISVILPSGEEKNLDDIAQGAAALKLFGATRWSRFRIWAGLGVPKARPVPLSDTRVVSAPSRGRPGRWLDWLLGREIVIRPL